MNTPDSKTTALGELDQESLDKLLVKNPEVSAAMFENGKGEIVVIYLKPMTREIWSMANRLTDKDPLQATEYMLNGLQIEGYSKDLIIKDLTALKNCTATIQELLFVKKGYLVDLKKN